MSIASRQELKDYCLRSLGHPLVEIDITPESMEDAIDESLEFFQEYYYDGTDRFFYKHQVTQDDIDNGWIPIPSKIWGVNRIFPMTNSGTSQANIFDWEFQFRSSDMMRNLAATDMVYYSQVMQHLSLVENLLNIQKQFRYNRNSDKLYIDMNWKTRMNLDSWIMIDCYAVLDPVENTKFWNNRVFKDYTTARFKLKWANAYKKFSNITLPGGITIDGGELYSEAVTEIKEIEEDIINNQAPLGFMIG